MQYIFLRRYIPLCCKNYTDRTKLQTHMIFYQLYRQIFPSTFLIFRQIRPSQCCSCNIGETFEEPSPVWMSLQWSTVSWAIYLEELGKTMKGVVRVLYNDEGNRHKVQCIFDMGFRWMRVESFTSMLQITWPRTLQPSVIHINSILNFNISVSNSRTL